MKRLLLAAALVALPLPAVAQKAPEGGSWTECMVGEIFADRDRLEIGCAGKAGGPSRFAIESRDPLAESLLRLALTAKDRARPLGVLYVIAPEANPEGCDPAVCRRLAAVSLK
ncbi:hypothetical protein GVN21_01795 [Caulobacter sp. SLTY]|uniref:hypothetical protein n=1 Tax=Caulobacter sp. SLTY TaxID=2683262 RepID=UPI00141343AD|nr:hypothetical protein [Caulobacter sp. SLTY]NBB14085.1 hypothetical protein [Caulobacter sp. SLTY]